MYTITISTAGTNADPLLCPDMDSTLQAVANALVDRVEPGRSVRWEVRCPSGRMAVGTLTVNDADSDGQVEIAEHIELVRDVLTEEARDDRFRT